MRQAKIAFIGGGNMTQSLVSGLINDEYDARRIWVIDHNQAKLDFLSQAFQVKTINNLEQTLPDVDIIILAIKPQSFSLLPIGFKQKIIDQKPIVISVVAAIDLASLAEHFGDKTPIIRAMPNTPALIQAGATGLFANDQANESQKSLAEHILRCVGQVVWLDNDAQMDIVTAISGSGPAYYFLFMEIFSAFATDLGLNEQSAKLLSIQTALGASKMALESSDDFTTLRQKVTSKGGCTDATIRCFEDGGIRALLTKGLGANIEQSKLLAKNVTQQAKLTDKKS